MRLTRYTDYAMRVLLYLGARQDRLCSIAEIAGAYGISQNHLMKVVSDLAGAGYLVSVRGRSGGVRLARLRRRSTSGRSSAIPRTALIWWTAAAASSLRPAG